MHDLVQAGRLGFHKATEINMDCWLERADVMLSIPREILMRILALTILTILAVWVAEPVRAQTYGSNFPVCLHVYDFGSNYLECAYTSLEQCAMSASGRAAVCVVNPYFAGTQERGAPRYRHSRVY
jgi:hypothetical protein